MRKYKSKNKKMWMLLIILLVSIGYALLSATLNINGIAKFKSGVWDIHWDEDSISVTEGSESADLPVVSNDGTTVSYEVTLELPGDFYEFTIDAVNVGTIDGMVSVDSIIPTIKDKTTGQAATLPSYIKYSVTYADGKEIKKYHKLAQRVDENTPTREKYKIRIEYDSESTTLPDSDKTYEIDTDIPYIQADDNSYDRNEKKGYELILSKASVEPSVLEPVAISHVDTEQLTARTDYRYMGANPNNYIYFNCSTDNVEEQNSSTCETWRIIGIFDNKIKIIREKKLNSDLAYDSNGNNDWSTSTLYNYLNNDYYNSLSTSSKKAIDDTKWYLGTWTHSWRGELIPDLYYGSYSTMPGLGQFPEGLYKAERSNVVSENNSTTNVIGKIGLMYPSDYAYSSSNCYSTCIATSSTCGMHVGNYALFTYYTQFSYHGEEGQIKAYGNNKCTSSTWFYDQFNSRFEEILNSPFITSYYYTLAEGEKNVLAVRDANYYSFGSGTKELSPIYPTLYLKSSIYLTGEGTRSNPYKIYK